MGQANTNKEDDVGWSWELTRERSVRRIGRVVLYAENNTYGGVRTDFDLPAKTQISAPNDNTFCAATADSLIHNGLMP
jgi:hypothetical protein